MRLGGVEGGEEDFDSRNVVGGGEDQWRTECYWATRAGWGGDGYSDTDYAQV